MSGAPTEGRAVAGIAEAGGEALQEELRRIGFLPVGNAAAAEAGKLPWKQLIVTAVPRWLTGKANELLALQRCYESVFRLASELGCNSLVMPFLSTCYYRFPLEDAIHVALKAAEGWPGETCFAADTAELAELSKKTWRKPQIMSYIGYYRDHALFALDNGLYARIDIRPELRKVDTIPYFEACYRTGNNPKQKPLPEEEIVRLRRIWEESEF